MKYKFLIAALILLVTGSILKAQTVVTKDFSTYFICEQECSPFLAFACKSQDWKVSHGGPAIYTGNGQYAHLTASYTGSYPTGEGLFFAYNFLPDHSYNVTVFVAPGPNSTSNSLGIQVKAANGLRAMEVPSNGSIPCGEGTPDPGIVAQVIKESPSLPGPNLVLFTNSNFVPSKAFSQFWVYADQRSLTRSGSLIISKVEIIDKGLNIPPITNNSICCAQSFTGPGDPAPLAGQVPTGGVGSYTYQWQVKNSGSYVNISGATGRDYDPPLLQATATYRRNVTSGTLTGSSNEVTISVTIPPLGNNRICCDHWFTIQGDPPILVGQMPTGGLGSYSYQWEYKNNGTFINVPGGTEKDYDPPVINTTTVYRRKVTSGQHSLYSNEATITITIPPITGNSICCAQTVCTSFYPAALKQSPGTSVGGGIGVYSYQWQSSTDGSTFSDLPLAKAASYSPGQLYQTTWFKRKITSSTSISETVVKITVFQVELHEVYDATYTKNSNYDAKIISIRGVQTTNSGIQVTFTGRDEIRIFPGAIIKPDIKLIAGFCGFTSKNMRVVPMEGEPNLLNEASFVYNDKSNLSAYPNPFSNSTTIKYRLLESGVARVYISDQSGKIIADLMNKKHQEAGEYEVLFTKQQVRPGIYLYSLETSSGKEVKRLIIQ